MSVAAAFAHKDLRTSTRDSITSSSRDQGPIFQDRGTIASLECLFNICKGNTKLLANYIDDEADDLGDDDGQQLLHTRRR